MKSFAYKWGRQSYRKPTTDGQVLWAKKEELLSSLDLNMEAENRNRLHSTYRTAISDHYCLGKWHFKYSIAYFKFIYKPIHPQTVPSKFYHDRWLNQGNQTIVQFSVDFQIPFLDPPILNYFIVFFFFSDKQALMLALYPVCLPQAYEALLLAGSSDLEGRRNVEMRDKLKDVGSRGTAGEISLHPVFHEVSGLWHMLLPLWCFHCSESAKPWHWHWE